MLKAGDTLGNYRIEGILGRGGMGVVYEAVQPSLDRRLALKVLRFELSEDPGFVERFRREGRLQAALDHPHVVPVYEAGESDQGLFLAMQLVRGSTLAELVRDGSLTASRALDLLDQVAQALDAAHAAGLVHRDVKPQNVLVAESDRAYLADFGLTKTGDGASGTATGSLMGTVAYMSPEVIAGDEATPASDRYAFAAMLFQCLSGEVPFPRPTDAAILYAHTHDPPPRISERRPELPTSLDALFETGLAKDPSGRAATAEGLLQSVRSALGDSVETLGPPPPRKPVEAEEETAAAPVPSGPARGGRRLGRTAAVLAAALVGAAIGVGAYAWSDDDKAASPGPPQVPKGARALGSELTATGVSVDCRGRRANLDSRPCTIVQVALPGRRVLIPGNGAIYGWAVSGAKGDIALQVMRRRGGQTFQMARSQLESVPDTRVHHFRTNLPASTGDLIGLMVGPGASFGLRRSVSEATTERWRRPLFFPRPRQLGPGTGVDGELLMRADFYPGRRQVMPRQISGRPAARQPRGRELARKPLRFKGGRVEEAAVVEIGKRVAMDLFSEGTRVDRVFLPQLRAGGRLVELFRRRREEGVWWETRVLWVNDGAGRMIEHEIGAYPHRLEYYR